MRSDPEAGLGHVGEGIQGRIYKDSQTDPGWSIASEAQGSI